MSLRRCLGGGFASPILLFELDFFTNKGDEEGEVWGSVVLGVLERMHELLSPGGISASHRTQD